MKTKTKKGIALIIANAEYQSQNKLPSCKKDGMAMKDVLESLDFDVIYVEDATRNLLFEKLEEFFKTGNLYSTVLVYYSGHGIQIDGENYFVPIDFSYNSSKAVVIGRYLVGINTVTEFMNQHPEKTNILILDACRTSLTFVKDIVGVGLAEMNAGNGTIIAFATSPNTAALCDSNGRDNSYYTKCLLKHIASPNIKIEDMFKRVRKDVVDFTKGKQVPWENTSLNADFYFSTMTQDEINERIYQIVRNHNIAETLVVLSNAYRISVSDVLRTYERQKSEKPGGICIKEKDVFEQYVLEKILGYGFELQNYRWIYNGIPVNMGEFFHDYTKPVVAK